VLRTDELDFELPEELIATTPAEPRDSARMLVVSRTDPSRLEHRRVRDLPDYLRRGDLMVVNSTRVIAARFMGTRVGTGGKLPGLYLGPAGGSSTDATPVSPPAKSNDRRWLVLIKGGHLHPGVRVGLGDGSVQLELIERSADESGAWLARVLGAGADESDPAVLERVGMTPLPPYILQARKRHGVEVADSYDRGRYQTVYAAPRAEGGLWHPGSVAAPTAGMHLTPGLLERLAEVGIRRGQVVLHVGTGTFKPVETEFLEQHVMHEEWCSVPRELVEVIGGTRAGGGRVLCVGTTTARALETYGAIAAEGRPPPDWTDTRLLISPGHQWRWVDLMLTNFHLPRSTLLAMVSSLFVGGLPRLKEIYKAAVGEGYRFFSYGDAMLVLP
jgi:S-adenosylmethionine:tRNA ribosyltransferase-isomerase